QLAGRHLGRGSPARPGGAAAGKRQRKQETTKGKVSHRHSPCSSQVTMTAGKRRSAALDSMVSCRSRFGPDRGLASGQQKTRLAAGFRKARPGRPLLDLGFLIVHVLAHHRIELLHGDLFRGVLLVLHGRVEVTGVGRGNELDLFALAGCHVLSPQTFSPRARRSATTTSMPFLSMMRRPLWDTRSFTKRPSDSSQNRLACRFGRKRRFVLLLACDTLFPVTGRLPVTWQTLDIVRSSVSNLV